MPPPFWGALSERPYGRRLSHRPGTVCPSLHGQNVPECGLTQGSSFHQLPSASRSWAQAARCCRAGQQSSVPAPAGFRQAGSAVCQGICTRLKLLFLNISGCVTKQGWRGPGKPAGSTLPLRQVRAWRCHHGGALLQDRGALAGDAPATRSCRCIVTCGRRTPLLLLLGWVILSDMACPANSIIKQIHPNGRNFSGIG